MPARSGDVRHLRPGWRISLPDTEPIIDRYRADLFPGCADTLPRLEIQRLSLAPKKCRVPAERVYTSPTFFVHLYLIKPVSDKWK